MVNMLLYSVDGQSGGARQAHNPKAAYCNRWLGTLAMGAYRDWAASQPQAATQSRRRTGCT
jgi:hypothetical protein